MLDIRRGDLATASDGKSFHIRDLESHQFDPGSTESFKHMCTERISLKRNPAVVAGKRGLPVAVPDMTDIPCTPFDSTSGELHAGGGGIGGGLPVELRESLVDGGDVYYRILVEERESPA